MSGSLRQASRLLDVQMLSRHDHRVDDSHQSFGELRLGQLERQQAISKYAHGQVHSHLCVRTYFLLNAQVIGFCLITLLPRSLVHIPVAEIAAVLGSVCNDGQVFCFVLSGAPIIVQN